MEERTTVVRGSSGGPSTVAICGIVAVIIVAVIAAAFIFQPWNQTDSRKPDDGHHAGRQHGERQRHERDDRFEQHQRVGHGERAWELRLKQPGRLERRGRHEPVRQMTALLE